MSRFIILCVPVVIVMQTPVASAQLTVRAPFVRVEVGGPGVYVRAPFVNLFVPTRPRIVYVSPPEGAPPKFEAPAPEALPETPKKSAPNVPPPPAPKPKNPDDAPPAPATPERIMTLDQFTKSFQPKAGNYEITLLNPVTNQATTVRFTLPEATPRRVQASRNRIEFDYGPRRYVRIEFDREGAEVSSR